MGTVRQLASIHNKCCITGRCFRVGKVDLCKFRYLLIYSQKIRKAKQKSQKYLLPKHFQPSINRG